MRFLGWNWLLRTSCTVPFLSNTYVCRPGKTRRLDELWREFFSNTSEWWDNRPDKMDPRLPDFKHKRRRESLWLADSRNPPWVHAELAAIPPGTLESNAFGWNQRLKSHAKAGQYMKTLEVFHQMQQERVNSDRWTFTAVLRACTGLGALEEGKHIHSQIIQVGCELDVYVATSLVDMYAKCGSIEDAQKVFKKMAIRDVVTWTAMVVGYAKSGHGLKAMELFEKMCHEGVEPNSFTFVGVLNACASVAALEEGRCIHEMIVQRSLESDVFVGNSLVDMYAKCGSLEDARRVFNQMRARDVVTWNAMIGAYAMHGHAEEAILLFERMVKEGIQVNGITFTGLLSACSHGGLVKRGLQYFESMDSHFGILPSTEHYACMVDLLGRAGRLGEAEGLAKRLPLDRGVSVWSSLLNSCRIHGNMEIAERAAKRCLELEPENASAYALLSNIYAATEKWDRSAGIEKERLRTEARLHRTELNDMVH